MKINMQPRLNKMDTIYFRVSPPEHTFRTCRHSKAYAPVTLHYNIKTVLPFISIYVEHIIIIFFSRWITTVPYYISRSSLVRVVQHYPHYYYRKKKHTSTSASSLCQHQYQTKIYAFGTYTSELVNIIWMFSDKIPVISDIIISLQT